MQFFEIIDIIMDYKKVFNSVVKSEFVKVSAVIFFVLLVFFYKPIITDKVLSPSGILKIFPPWNKSLPLNFKGPVNPILRDSLDQFYPWYDFAGKVIRNGELPLWNPYMQSGVPFIANYQSAVFFPLHLIFYYLPLTISSWLVPLLKLYIAGIFTYYFLRSLKVSMFPSLLSAIAFMFNANMISYIIKSQGSPYIFLPALFLFSENLFDAGIRKRSFFFLAMIVGIQFLGGHPETSFNIVVFSSAYFFIRLIANYKKSGDYKSLKRQAIMFVSANVIGFFMAAIQVFPFLEYLSLSLTYLTRSSHTHFCHHSSKLSFQ